MEQDDVLAAFDALMEALDGVKAQLAEDLKEATIEERFADAQQILQKTKHLQQLKEQASQLRDTYKRIDENLADHFRDAQHLSSVSTRGEESSPELGMVESIFGRRRKPRRTNQASEKLGENTLRIAILEALQQFEGRAYRNEVVYLVRELLKNRLSDEDTAKPAGGRMSRLDGWINSERQAMIREGLLNPDTPFGVWQITETGRAYLERARSQQNSRDEPN